MTEQPDRQPSSSPADGAAPLDDTQRIEVPRFAPAPEPRPDTRWAWAGADPRNARAAAASSMGEPSQPQDRSGALWASDPGPKSTTSRPSAAGGSAATSWPAADPAARPASLADAAPGDPDLTERTGAWAAPASRASVSWAFAGGDAAQPVATTLASAHPAASRRTGPGIGTVAAVALLSAVLASSGTVVALDATGSFQQAAATPQTAPVASQAAAAPQSGGTITESSAVITSSAKVSPSVVKITAKSGSDDPFTGTQNDGIGSGIIYDAGGWILTNHHVVTGATTLTVELKDGRTFSGSVYGIDTLTDLAIVKVDATGLPAATLGSSDGLKVGQLVVAVGSPLGTYSFSVTSGIVSGKGRSIIVSDGSTISNLIQTDAAINPGNSGGPLADADGNVVGINTAIADGSNGIGFAIPIDIAKPIMKQAVKGEKLERPWIGVRYEAVDEKVKDAHKLTVDNGALIINDTGTGAAAILPNSPAATAGLKEGDIITAINGIAVDQEHPLNLLLVQFAPDDVVQLTVLRDGKTLTVPLTLGVRPNDLQ